MRSRIQSYWNFGSTYCSVELTSVLGKDKLFVTVAKKKKSEFENFTFFESYSISSLSKNLNKNQHCFLTINTDKVLIKEADPSEDTQKMISQAFPGLSLSQFYVEIIQQTKRAFICICRKDYIDQILNEFKDQKIEVIGFGLGFGVLTNVTPLIGEDRMASSRFDFDKIGSEIISFKESEIQNELAYQIDDVKVTSNYLISLAGLFNYLKSDTNTFKNYVEENRALKKLHNQKVFFRKGLGIGLGVLLFSLVVNLFLLTSYNKEKQTLEQQVYSLESQKEKFTDRNTEIRQKESIVNSILNSSSSKCSYYINRVVDKMPSSIVFNDIKYQPLLRSTRPDKVIEYDENTLTLSGESAEKPSFSLWIEELEQLDWIENVTVTNYGVTGRDVSSFGITIKLNNDAKK